MRFLNRSPDIHTRSQLTISGGLMALVFGVHFWLVWVGPLPGDRWAAGRAYWWSRWPAPVRDFGSLFSAFGTWWMFAVVVGGGLAVLLIRGRPGEAEGLLVAATATPLCELLKHLFGITPLTRLIVTSGSDSYPSGHVTFVTASVGFLGLCAWRRGRRRLAAVALALVVLIGPERVISGVHTVSDAIGGYLLGGAWLLLAELCVSNRLNLLPRPSWAGVLTPDHEG